MRSAVPSKRSASCELPADCRSSISPRIRHSSEMKGPRSGVFDFSRSPVTNARASWLRFAFASTSANMTPGKTPVVIDTPVGCVGLTVCYDVRFPELFRNLSAAGAQIFSVPSAFTAPTGRAHWETLLRARAIENLCHVIAPAQSGFHPNGRETHGDSMIIDHWGRILARLPRGCGFITAEIDLTRQAEVRKSFPALSHRVL